MSEARRLFDVDFDLEIVETCDGENVAADAIFQVTVCADLISPGTIALKLSTDQYCDGEQSKLT